MISVIFQYLVRLPHFFVLLFKDFLLYLRHKRWLLFEGWGLHLYVGMFGAGKTCSLVNDAYRLARQYPQLTIVTNLQLSNFPPHTQILPLRCTDDILNAPVNTLVLIDEIGTLFNSRDFSAGKGLPKILFQHLVQCRKRRMMILATTQRWNFLDKQLRDITDTVRVTRSHFGHPWTRICTVWRYDAAEYDTAYTNPLLPLRPLYGKVYVQTDACRNRYDTSALIDGLLAAEYIPDEEIAANRAGEPVVSVAPVADKKVYRAAKRRGKRAG